jgi:N-acetylglucosaminyldiphosphoundecaprenol N-acetyl-beta-D-mannosaminyltransferase
MSVKRKVYAIVESAKTARALEIWLIGQGIDRNWNIEVAITNFASDPAEQIRVARAIKASMAEVLVMTIGAPASEVFIDLHRDVLPPCWALCVGQALRVELGLVSRAPKAWRVLGLEWAWRCKKEPKRLPLRYLRDLVWFPRAIFNDIFVANGL